MPRYRFYLLDAQGHIERSYDVECADDTAALKRARAFEHPRVVETWSGSRKVGEIGPRLPS